MSKGKKNTALWEDYKKELHDMWKGNEDMVDYCMKACAEVVGLPNGMLHDIDKEHIQTGLCFGYSDMGYGPSYEDACKSAREAREAPDAFMTQNMRTYTDALHNLSLHGERHFVCMASSMPRIKGIRYVRVTDVLEAVGGSAVLGELKGTVADVRGERVYICTDEDVALLKEGYERAAAVHEKKLRAYLKRYGTSKLHIWTYWMDD